MMKVKKELLVKALVACKFREAAKFADAKLVATANKLPKTMTDDDIAKITPPAGQAFVKKLIAALAAGEALEITDGGKPAAAPAAKAADGKKGKAPPKKASESGPGIIESIVEFLSKGSKTNPLKKDDIVSQLAKRFPDRAETSLRSTVNQQVPTKLRKEKGHAVEKNENGYWIKK